MRHRKKGAKLGRPKAHREALLMNLANATFTHYGIVTTQEKAKEVTRLIARLIDYGKQGDIPARREVNSLLRNREMVLKLFKEIAPRFTERKSGYTRIVKLAPRKGDGAHLALLELLGFEKERKEKQDKLEQRRKDKAEKQMRGM
jgi:large subunit ribosomal protein L17